MQRRGRLMKWRYGQPVRVKPSTVGKDQGFAAWTQGICWPHRSRQPAVCEWGTVGITLGARWHDLPERYGKYKSVHKRFVRWAHSGVWERVFHALVRDSKNQYLMLDSTIVRAHQQAATGRKKGVRTRLWGVPEEV